MRPVAALILSATVALAVAACGAAGPTDPPRASASPSAAPNPTPTPVTDPHPRVDLVVANGWDVAAVVSDRTGILREAASGSAGPSMSVHWFDAKVVNREPATIEVTWVGLPRDEVVGVEIVRTDEGITIEIVQAAPPLNSDAEGSDRVLVLTFEEPVPAESVKVNFGASNPT